MEKFINRVLKLLEKSRLSIGKQLELAKKLKKLFLDFLQVRHTLLSLKPYDLQLYLLNLENLLLL